MRLPSTPLILLLTIALITPTLSLHQRTPQALADQVKELEGYYNFTGDFEMYSGYLKIQQQPQISIHYIFITSQRDPAKDDVTLWLNGGPGCSSLLGFAQEVGPNMLMSGAKKFASVKNPYSWNQVSNMLFFESPAGVGFSINDDPIYNYTDPRTAQDSLKTLQMFYQRFPEFKQNNFWIAGESYCGMYIPFLANEVLTQDNSIKLQGILIGNGAMWLNMNWRGMIGDRFWASHYYYGPEITKLLSKCSYTDDDAKVPSCLRGMFLAERAVQNVNPYLTTGVCYTPDGSQEIVSNENKADRRRFSRVPFHTTNKNRLLSDVESGSDSPCTDDAGITQYFNRPKVRQQLKIVRDNPWAPCARIKYTKSNSSLHFFESFKQKGLKVLLYSGNVDAVVPYVETEEYIKFLGWEKKSDKVPLVNARGSLMGWQLEYDGLTYVIINGAGHMVPTDKPHAAYEMFKKFIGADRTEQSTQQQVPIKTN